MAKRTFLIIKKDAKRNIFYISGVYTGNNYPSTLTANDKTIYRIKEIPTIENGSINCHIELPKTM